MRIFLTGATGFIGEHVLRALVERGHEVTCLARGAGVLRIDARAWPGVSVVEGEFTRPGEPWSRALAGHDAVVNAVGIIRETAGATFEDVHERAAVALFEASARAGARKIVQVSALGADDGARARYHLSKRAADRRLASLGVPYVILRPSVVYGAGDRSMTYFSSLASLRVTPVPGDGQYLLQPVYVDDLVRAVVMAVERPDLQGFAVDVGGGRAVTFDQLMDILAHWLGRRKARIVHVPWPIMAAVAALTDRLGVGPITTEELGMLRRGNAGDNGPFVERFGFTPVPVEVGMARRPRTEAALWHARLGLVSVPLRLSIAFIWLATAFVTAFVYPREESLALLARCGITGPLAGLALNATCALEALLGMATLANVKLRLVGAIQIALIVGFTAILTLVMPELWMHPFGPLTKNVPLVAATVVMIGLNRWSH